MSKPKRNVGPNVARTIDQYCDAVLQFNAANRIKKQLRNDVLEHCTVDKPVVTDRFCVTYVEESFESLDVDAIREKMSAKWLKKFTRVGTRQKLVVTERSK